MDEKKMNIALLTHADRLISSEFIEILSTLGNLQYPSQESVQSPDTLRDILRQTDIAVTGWGTPLLPPPEKESRLRYICHMTGELKRIVPREYIDHPDIQVTNWGDSFAFSTAEGAVALIFAVLKNVVNLDAKLRQTGRPGPLKRSFYSLRGTRVGLYGLSSIGRRVAQYLKPFSPILSFYDPTVTEIPEGLARHPTLDSLFAENDIVTIHAGLNEATRGSVDYRRLSLMPKDGILINTARGPLVVEKDLARILSEGHINAGVDVIDNEDDWKASPLINLPNVIFTGHVLSQIGLQEKHCLQETALANLKRYLRGDTLRHPVTPERFQLMT